MKAEKPLKSALEQAIKEAQATLRRLDREIDERQAQRRKVEQQLKRHHDFYALEFGSALEVSEHFDAQKLKVSILAMLKTVGDDGATTSEVYQQMLRNGFRLNYRGGMVTLRNLLHRMGEVDAIERPKGSKTRWVLNKGSTMR